ncbi:hypothetical protein N7456_005982 [Penicillium angulare]|uniref:Uncharacterized protein n=1 Tax=Penicillium angulare TaxID=116970 RepID=A0A9W9KL25_9EURO|nr:hypothetical protein N7456_005982 [Penicillium angulare]
MSHERKNFVELALEETFTPEEKEQKELWSKHLYGVGGLCAEAWLGLFLIRLPNLRILEFQHENSELISDILLKAAKRQQPFHQTPPFPHLQEIRACVGWGASWIDSDFLNPFFYFPDVRKIYGTAIGEKNEKAVVVRENLPKKCPVQTVIVEEGYWCRGMLNWLGLCTDLQHICITIEIQADEYELDEEDQFDASEFRLALLPFTTTLRTIRIRYADSYKDHVIDEKEDIEVPFGSFKDFIFLETLTVRHDHLMKLRDDSTIDWHMHTLTEILPHCLLNLEIIDVMVDYHLQLSSELLKILRPGRCPINLQRLKLCIGLADSDELGDMFRDLELECQAANVYLEIETS